MNYTLKLLPILLLFIPLNAYALSFDHVLSKGPLIAVNRDKNGKFDSITTYALVYAPLRYVWDTLLNIEDYARYMPRMVKSEIVERSADNTEIIAEFEVSTFIANTNYALKYCMDVKNRTITISHHSGDLKGSQWLWEFKKQGERTVVICKGASKNFSTIIKAVDDKMQTLTIGINIVSTLTNIRHIKERAEALYADDKGISKGAD